MQRVISDYLPPALNFEDYMLTLLVMITYAEATRILREKAEFLSLKSESVPIKHLLGRTLSKNLICPHDLPFFNQSSMDGFVVEAELTANASTSSPETFEIYGIQKAGEELEVFRTDCSRVAIQIMTGAPIPLQFFKNPTVYKIEDVVISEQRVSITHAQAAGTFIRLKGEDYQSDSQLLPQGTKLRAHHLMMLASFGSQSAEVFCKPRVALITTGKEITDSDLTLGKVRNSTQVYLRNALKDCDVVFGNSGPYPDTENEFLDVLKIALSEKPDLVIATGAVSMGVTDFIPSVLKQLRAETFFHKVAIRPGKPILFSKLENGPFFFGLPGNPVSSVIGCKFFIDEFLGAKPQKLMQARLFKDVSKQNGLRCFFKASLEVLDGALFATADGNQGSHILSSLSDGFIELPEGRDEFKAGELVRVHPNENFFC